MALSVIKLLDDYHNFRNKLFYLKELVETNKVTSVDPKIKFRIDTVYNRLDSFPIPYTEDLADLLHTLKKDLSDIEAELIVNGNWRNN